MSQRGKGSTGAFGLSRGKRFAMVVGRILRGPRRCEIMIRSEGRVRYLSLPGPVQIVVLAVLAAASGWVGYSSLAYVRFEDILTGRDREIERVVAENRGLLGSMARMRSEFSDVAGTLERNHRELENLVGQNDGLRRDLTMLRTRLSRANADRQAGEKRQIALRQQIESLEGRLASAEQQSHTLAGTLMAARAQIASAEKDRDGVATERRTLQARVAGLESRLASLQNAQTDFLDRVTGKTTQDIERIERLIANTGLDADNLIARIEKIEKKEDNDRAGDERTGLGGPFIPAAEAVEAKAKGGETTILTGLRKYDRHMTRWEDLQKLLRSLPLVPPLDHYRLNSGFGKRRDPINGRMAVHEGVDLGATRRAPVHATAPGKVIVAGWNGKFGRMVEIDHGFGIRTRYAHMLRLNVRRGQAVGFGHVIGQVGSSGRSTGNHLHYEIQVERKPVDPERFMRAGKDVFKR
jgi:murein DD-endopeptidase MepM/ murein hydrolase activator NlpD